MITFNKEKLHTLFETYKQHFSTNFPEEKYKWEALKCFQDNWNIDAPDFKQMLSVAMSKTENLLAINRYFPLGILKDFCDLDVEATRDMFRSLYDESLDVTERIQDFHRRSDEQLEKLKENPKVQKDISHYQDLKSISTYLWLRYPEKYFIYKYKEAKEYVESLECSFKVKNGIRKETIVNVMQLYEAIAEYIRKDEEYVSMLAAHMDDSCYNDTSMHLTVSDFAYFNKNKKNTDESQASEPTAGLASGDVSHWWLSANPKIFSPGVGWEVDKDVEYTLLNDNGHKRRIYQNYLDAKAGDKVVCYESTPTLQVVALAEVTFRDETLIGFRKVANVVNPIDYAYLKQLPELQGMEFFKNPNGSFFKLTTEEYDAIMEVISTSDAPLEKVDDIAYTEQDFLDDVFISKKDMETLEYLLEHKKNVILQGAPGVGKTYSAKRLAYKMMGKKDERRICMVQFHQNYSYEDFVLGYKPVENGFKLQEGKFYNFCVLAANHPDDKYFFIIDEINRGNLSKIFGELLMAIESSYRGTKVRLAYGEKEFSVPENLCIIGMMNTADRSLALIDYALRRRFSFFKMRPGFDTDGFINKFKEVSNAKFTKLIDVVKQLNEAIANDASLGEGFQIGHSYFCKSGEIDYTWLSTLVEYDLIPMLEEYWFDNEKEVEKWSEQLRMAIV